MIKEIDDVLINKITKIKRCIKRAKEEYQLAEEQGGFENNFARQDSAILNVMRACGQAIDISNHIVRKLDLGTPTSAHDSFELLFENKIIEEEMYEAMKKMAGFRNILTHEYEKVDINIVKSAIQNKIDELLNFAEFILQKRNELLDNRKKI